MYILGYVLMCVCGLYSIDLALICYLLMGWVVLIIVFILYMCGCDLCRVGSFCGERCIV